MLVRWRGWLWKICNDWLRAVLIICQLRWMGWQNHVTGNGSVALSISMWEGKRLPWGIQKTMKTDPRSEIHQGVKGTTECDCHQSPRCCRLFCRAASREPRSYWSGARLRTCVYMCMRAGLLVTCTAQSSVNLKMQTWIILQMLTC
jgi:hypothetical protein